MFNHAALILSPQDCSHSEEMAAMKGFFTNWLIIGCWSFFQHPSTFSSMPPPTFIKPYSLFTNIIIWWAQDCFKQIWWQFSRVNDLFANHSIKTTVFVCEAPNSSSSEDPSSAPTWWWRWSWWFWFYKASLSY